ncbi:hypothetical protein DV738_g2120, partial [Chaetothyriales sp. CBS 135597]
MSQEQVASSSPSDLLCPNWVYSAASNSHVCKNRGWFTEYTPFKSWVHNIYSLDFIMDVVGVGVVVLRVKKGPNRTGPDAHADLVLKEVLHCPSSLCNIIGLPDDFKETYYVKSDRMGETMGRIKDKDGRSVAYFGSKDRMFQVQLSEPPVGPVVGPSVIEGDWALTVNAFWFEKERARWEDFKKACHRPLPRPADETNHEKDTDQPEQSKTQEGLRESARENRVLPSQTRANGSVFGHGGPAFPSGDFFTDSLLEDTSSRIPSPTSAKKSKPTSANSREDFRTSTSSNLSTPPKALTEVYQRIDDEQALAAAEREDRSSEGGSDRYVGLPVDATDTAAAGRAGDVDLQLTGTLSEGTGMSFLKGLTDQNIANSITPAVSSHVKDMRRLGISTKPIVFNPGIKPSEKLADDDLDDDDDEAIDWTKSLPAESKKLFPLGGRLNGHNADKAHSDSSLDGRNKPPQRVFQIPLANTQQPADQLEVGGAGKDDGENDDDGYSTDEDLRKREVAFKFSQLAKKMNLKSSQAGSDELGGRQTPRPEKAKPDGGEEGGDQDKRQDEAPGSHDQHRRAPSFDSQASSSVNWGAIDEDMPMRSIESAANEASGSVWSQSSPGRVKRWDNDFTGVSFQVSDSPPVKSRAKPAIAAQEGVREAAMRLSRSISDDTALQTDVKDEELTTDTRPHSAGEQGHNAPVVISRSSTSSQGTPTADTQPPFVPSRSRSHDLIQRLSRLGSTTPRSSPRVTKEDVKKELSEEIDVATKDETSTDLSTAGGTTEEKTAKKPIVAATPRVTGAWTDTILPEPDTVKTAKPEEAEQQKQPPSGYVQTPHIKAGGWVDTPLLSMSERASSTAAAAMATIEDVTEELDTNVVSVDPSEQNGSESSDATALPAEAPAAVPKSAWASIREQQKQLSGDPAAVSDTLVLGNDTLASLDSVLDKTWQNADDLIKLSGSASITATGEQDGGAGSSGEADTTKQLEILLLGTLQTLQSNIQSARQGISKLEQEQQAQEKALLDLLARLPPENNSSSKKHSPSKKSHRIYKKIQTQITSHSIHLLSTLGLLVCWYLLECTLAEVIAHPVVAERSSTYPASA